MKTNLDRVGMKIITLRIVKEEECVLFQKAKVK